MMVMPSCMNCTPPVRRTRSCNDWFCQTVRATYMYCGLMCETLALFLFSLLCISLLCDPHCLPIFLHEMITMKCSIQALLCYTHFSLAMATRLTR